MMSLKLNIKTVIASIFTIYSFSFAEVYTIKKGDTIEKIAKKYNISEEEIMKVNNIKDPKKIREGQKIQIPKSTVSSKKSKYSSEEVYEVKYGDTIEKIAKKYGLSVKDIMDYNNMKDEKIFAGDQLKIPLSKESLKRKRQEEARERIDLSKCEVYTLKKGGTLKHVSIRTDVDVKTLEELNNISRSTWLEAGTKICIGQKKTDLSQKRGCELMYKPKERVSLYDISKQFNIPKEKIKEINSLSTDYINKGQTICLKTWEEKSIKEEKQESSTKTVTLPKEVKPKDKDEEINSTNNIKLGWPVRGSIVAGFQNDDNVRHLGVDISTSCNEKVLAAESGKVIYAGDGIKAFGNLVVIRHDNGLTTVYGYLDKITVLEGSIVSKGEEIGRTGRLKNSDNCGIYFEVRKNVTPIDPLKVLN